LVEMHGGTAEARSDGPGRGSEFIDIGMPMCDGYEVARRMRTEPGLRATLVALTGYGEARHRRLSRDAGFDQHVTKPVDISKLEKLLTLPNRPALPDARSSASARNVRPLTLS
jgi:CheY-like chemotaxis protein